MSTLPPQSTIPTLLIPFNALNLPDMATATPTAALGSMTSFIRMKTILIASMISSSDTVITSSIWSLMIGHVILPVLVSSPSAQVCGLVCGTHSPDAKLRAASSAPMGSAAKILIPGWIPLAAMQHPESIPPPPIGTIKASSFSPGTCSRNSKARVPCPLMISGWSYGGIRIDPGFSASTLLAVSSRDVKIGLHGTTVAPYSLTAFTFTLGALSGMTIIAGICACFAAKAKA
mmetsp:Transcript_34071/g.53111  ORF Transcript_34071/g.53111 Transcript_34071/m.53111 type:complete len:232 (+) Transcript_34071:177-872(+)